MGNGSSNRVLPPPRRVPVPDPPGTPPPRFVSRAGGAEKDRPAVQKGLFRQIFDPNLVPDQELFTGFPFFSKPCPVIRGKMRPPKDRFAKKGSDSGKNGFTGDLVLRGGTGAGTIGEFGGGKPMAGDAGAGGNRNFEKSFFRDCCDGSPPRLVAGGG